MPRKKDPKPAHPSWPDHANPGCPPDWQHEGWHWLRIDRRGQRGPRFVLRPVLWREFYDGWRWDYEVDPATDAYVAPCPLPVEDPEPRT